MAFFTAADGRASPTARSGGSSRDGSLPEDAIVDRDSTPAEVLQDARLTLPYALPRVPRLELKVMGRRRYATILDPEAGAAAGGLDGAKPKEPARRRLFAYERVLGRVRFFLDRAVYADSARALLPEIGAYAAGLIDHVFRAELQLELTDGGTATVGARARATASGAATSSCSPRTRAGGGACSRRSRSPTRWPPAPRP